MISSLNGCSVSCPAVRSWRPAESSEAPEEDPFQISEPHRHPRGPNRWVQAARVADLLRQWTGHTSDDGEALHRAVRSHAAALTALDEDDFARLRAVLTWLVVNPDSGVYIRQLPIRGVDTKWTKNHRGMVTGLHRAITGRGDLGLAGMPDLIRMRFLDPALAPAGVSDLSAPASELDALDLTPDAVLVVENLETLVALPRLPGVVVVLGSGHAVDRLSKIGWLRRARRLLYWGDLDSHGFAILDRFRAHFPRVTSVLMDVDTLGAHRDLWVPEPKPTRADLTRLTAGESAALAMVRAAGDVRLEQERLDLAEAVTSLRQSLPATTPTIR